MLEKDLHWVVEAAIVMGKVLDAVELTVCDVTAEAWRTVGKSEEDMSLERTVGLAVLGNTSEGSTVLGNEKVE